MKIGLRADASEKIGVGHAMRLLALAEELLSRGIDAAFVGSFSNLAWFESRLRGLPGLEIVAVTEGTFDARVFRDLGITSVVVDSYAFTQSDLDAWQDEGLEPLVVVDGPWQKIMGGSFVAPILDSSASWLANLRKNSRNLYAGPSYAMLRTEVTTHRSPSSAVKTEGPRVVVSFGGAETFRLSELLLEKIGAVIPNGEIVIYGPRPHYGRRKRKMAARNVEYKPQGSGFLEAARSAEAVVTGAGLTVFELAFLGVRAIYIPITGNQAENARGIELVGLGTVVDPEDGGFEELLLTAVSERLAKTGNVSLPPSTSHLVDGRGAARVADIATKKC